MMAPTLALRKLVIAGVGLIGGSLALAARRAGLLPHGEIVGVDIDKGRLQRALELGVIDSFDTHLPRAAQGADVVLLATPVGGLGRLLELLRPQWSGSAVVTDVGSVKGSVVAEAQRIFGAVPPNFVPGHPIAGAEKSGVEHAFASLFDGRRVVLTPMADTDGAALAIVRNLWINVGAQVFEMSVEHHDRIFAATSHAPHVLSFCLVHALSRLDNSDELLQYAAGGFRDFTRIAASDPLMWRDIALANREALLAVLARFDTELHALMTAIEQGDGARLYDVFRHAKKVREEIAGRLK